WTAGDRRPVVLSASALQLFESRIELLPDGSPVGEPADRVAIGVQRKLVELAESALKGGEGMNHLLHVNIFHSEIENHRGREGERIAGEEVQRLFFAVLEDVEVFCREAVYQASRFVFHGYGNHNLVSGDRNLIKLLLPSAGRLRGSALRYGTNVDRRRCARIRVCSRHRCRSRLVATRCRLRL